ncbi:MAG: DUF6492 family protein [Simkaniaceae bacterium]|nr:DUF6492 family protein [Simkaniaceae bacterium]
MKRFIFPSVVVVFCVMTSFVLGKKQLHYSYPTKPIDVIIPCTYKDTFTLPQCIQGVKRYVRNIRRIIVISPEKLTDDAEWFDENLYPFSKADISKYIFNDPMQARAYIKDSKNRLGWIIQQLYKLYAPFIIPDLSEHYFVIDSDTVMLKPLNLFDQEGHALFTCKTGVHQPYIEHASRLVPNFTTYGENLSAIAHCMVFKKSIVKSLMDVVENHHHMPFWAAFAACTDLGDLPIASASEYEIYFNFAMTQTDEARIRKLKWKDISKLHKVSTYKREGYHYVANHSWRRKHKKRRFLP